MNKKHLNTVLILLLIIIWGAVGYKYFGNSTEASKEDSSTEAKFFYENLYVVSKDTFLLKLTDRDPFGIYRKAKKKAIKSSVKKAISILKPVQNKKIVWPKITYHGFVKNNSRNTPLILLKVNNRLYKKREKEIVSKMTLLKAYNDSLVLSLNGNIKTVTKQN